MNQFSKKLQTEQAFLSCPKAHICLESQHRSSHREPSASSHDRPPSCTPPAEEYGCSGSTGGQASWWTRSQLLSDSRAGSHNSACLLPVLSGPSIEDSFLYAYKPVVTCLILQLSPPSPTLLPCVPQSSWKGFLLPLLTLLQPLPVPPSTTPGASGSTRMLLMPTSMLLTANLSQFSPEVENVLYPLTLFLYAHHLFPCISSHYLWSYCV